MAKTPVCTSGATALVTRLTFVDKAGVLYAVEIKSGQTVVPDMFRTLKKWQAISQTTTQPVLIFGGDGSYVREGIQVTAWREMMGTGLNS